MRTMLAAFALAFGMITIADLTLASIYVPGQIRDGIYVRPHFIASPKSKFEDAWPTEGLVPTPEKGAPPVLDVIPPPRGKGLGEPS